MLSLKDFGDLPVILSNSLLSKTPLWKREVRTITPTDLNAFVALHKGTSQYAQALREVNVLVDVGIESLANGQLKQAEFAFYDNPEPTFIVSDLIEWISDMPIIRRRATLFALEMKMQPREVVELSWGHIRKLDLTLIASELVRAMPRHIRLNYVFWDTLPNGAAAPLFGLSESILEASQGLGFDTMLRLYNRMVMIDSNSDALDFVEKMNLTGMNRIHWDN